MLGKLDNFGGIIGIQYDVGDGSGDPANTTDIHYSQLQKNYELIHDCTDGRRRASSSRPAGTTRRMGAWNPLLDGLIVSVDGQCTRAATSSRSTTSAGTSCATPTATEVSYTSASHAVDPQGRMRVPYGFATDSWADLGNLSVYRHDNGADPYELFDFLITQQEVDHIFDNYRRNRQTFSVRNASNRTLERYNEKLRDAAKGLGPDARTSTATSRGPGLRLRRASGRSSARQFFADNLLASGIGFDHFARQLARPEAGPALARARTAPSRCCAATPTPRQRRHRRW